MLKTGNSYIDYFLLGLSFLPLAPSLIIILRRLYLQEPLNFLLPISLLCFLRNFSFDYPALINKVLDLLIFLLLVWAFRSNLKGRVRYGVTLGLTAAVAVVCTYWGLAGWGGAGISVALTAYVGLVIGFSLTKLIRNEKLQILGSRLFWMETGTLFYVVIFLLLALVGPDGDPERQLFLGLADGIRFVLYIVAAAL